VDPRYNLAVPAYPAPSLTLSDAPLPTLAADALIVPWFEEELTPRADVADATAGTFAAALAAREFRGKAYETLWLPVVGEGWATRRVLIVGAGRRPDYTPERARRVATASGLAARQRRQGHVAFVGGVGGSTPELVQAVAEGLMLASFDGDVYKTSEREAGPLTAATIVVEAASNVLAGAVARGHVLGAASNAARALANEPGNVLTPSVFADRASALARGAGLRVDVLDEPAIEALGMGLLLGVARGSAEPPRLIVIEHVPLGAAEGPVLGLVGKGITFDTGGISIKPADGMDRMKDDMAGGAAVVAAMCAIAELGAPIRVVGVIPSAENMPGGRAIKPGDVLRGASGKTVEVLNTDAEGRLILGDALWYARTQRGATHLVDIATLTGACVVALGRVTSGLFGTPSWWVDLVRETADRAGDRVWPMPIHEDYAEQIRSDIADVANVGGRAAGAITAALFLKEFTGDLPWVHLDIAGTAWTDEPKAYQPKGANGVAVRTLAELAFTASRWPIG
jgi:leucyl aminopeptidase